MDTVIDFAVWSIPRSIRSLNGVLIKGLCLTHQYGVPMKESLLCRVLVFFADTPKSATRIKRDKRKMM